MQDETEFNVDIDFEDMDDLAHHDHIEWNPDQMDEFTLDSLDIIHE